MIHDLVGTAIRGRARNPCQLPTVQNKSAQVEGEVSYYSCLLYKAQLDDRILPHRTIIILPRAVNRLVRSIVMVVAQGISGGRSAWPHHHPHTWLHTNDCTWQ